MVVLRSQPTLALQERSNLPECSASRESQGPGHRSDRCAFSLAMPDQRTVAELVQLAARQRQPERHHGESRGMVNVSEVLCGFNTPGVLFNSFGYRATP